MRLLLDAHTLIWAVDDPAKLGAQATPALQDPANELLLSAGTIWELAIKIGLGKLTLSLPFRQWMKQALDDLGVTVLPITVEHAAVQADLAQHHGDPFDRLLVAQAQVEKIALVSKGIVFDQSGTTPKANTARRSPNSTWPAPPSPGTTAVFSSFARTSTPCSTTKNRPGCCSTSPRIRPGRITHRSKRMK